MTLSHARPQTLSGAWDARELYGLRPLCPQLRDCLTDHEPKFIISHRTVSIGMKKLSAYVDSCVESCKQTSENRDKTVTILPHIRDIEKTQYQGTR